MRDGKILSDHRQDGKVEKVRPYHPCSSRARLGPPKGDQRVCVCVCACVLVCRNNPPKKHLSIHVLPYPWHTYFNASIRSVSPYHPQVYKATLRSNGKSVAVKVQRPGVLETVSLDLHLARQLGYLLRKVRKNISQYIGNREVWGKGVG